MKRIIAFILMSALVFVTGCSKNNSIKAEKLSGNERIQHELTDVVIDDEFREATADFAIELFKRSKGDSANVLVSPVSVMLALGMTASGADGVTLAEFEKVLGNELTIDELNAYYRAYVNSLPNTKETKMSIANSIWFNDIDSFKVNEEFLNNNEIYYNADIYKAAFDKKTVKDINNWAEEKTDGMIKEVIEELSPEALMVLMNAITFDGEWVEFYEDNQVRGVTFTNSDGDKQDASGMYCSEYIYLEDENTTGFIKHYKDGYSFVALLPDENISIEDYVAGFTGSKYMDLISSQIECKVDTMIPKFKYDFSMNANNVLTDMGIVNAFDVSNADFSKTGSYYDGMGNLYIGSVIHKTHIEMGEKGTRAGAVTAVIECGTSVMIEQPKEVILDRPFVYAIIDDATNIPIFIGTLNSIE